MRFALFLITAVFVSQFLPPSIHAARAASESNPSAEMTAFRQDPAAGLKGWETKGGTWTAENGRLLVRAPDAEGNSIALPRRAPLVGTQTLSATVNVHERLTATGWSVAGILLYSGSSEFRTLTLTQDEAGKRYVDFLENSGGIWQAQSADGPTRLTAGPSGGTRAAWIPNHDYRMELKLDGDRIAAAVTDSGTGQAIATGSYRFGSAEAVRIGTMGLTARGCAAAFSDSIVNAPASALELPGGIQVEKGPKGSIAMLRDALPGMDLAAVDSLASRLRRGGFGVSFISAANATNPAVLDPQHFSIFAIPNSEVYPADGSHALANYVRRGGHLLLLGGPPFSRPLWRRNGEWVDADAVRARLERLPTEHVFLGFEPGQALAGWSHGTNDSSIKSNVSIDPSGPEGKGGSLKVSMDDMTGWSTYGYSVPGAFPAGQELLAFWAKGDPRTSQLCIEMNETDGSRWMAVVSLTTDWTYHVVRPEDFHYWNDAKTTRPRGGIGDHFNPAEAQRIILGLAHSHTQKIGPGPHTFWVAQLGSLANPYAGMILKSSDAFFPIETVTPSYKLYPVGDLASIEAVPGQAVLPFDLHLAAPGPAYSCIERPMGKGFDNHPHWRWIPLLRAMDGRGRRAGTAAWLLLNEVAPFRGSIDAVFALRDQQLFQGDALGEAVVNAAARMVQGVFLAEAGSHDFCYWPGEKVGLGASVVNWGAEKASLHLRFTITARDGGRKLFSTEDSLDLDPDDAKTITRSWDPAGQVGDCDVVTELLQGDRVVDRVAHEVGFLSSAKPAADAFVRVKGSDFILNGKKWYPVGVNFWPLSVSGLEPSEYNGHWLTRGFYDPDQVERDLEKVSALGMNMVSIQMSGEPGNRNLLDFLRRCDRHGIKVNGFLTGASPLDFNETLAREIVQADKLDQNPTLFAYDIIWEPGNHVFNAAGRPHWDPDWEQWIVQRYGSVESAEADWGMPAPRADGKITSPSNQQMEENGPWRTMVAAYRRFMDDLISRKWNDATRRLREIDPNHLISFRQGNTLPQDFAFTGPVKHIDFICPEGYSISHDERGYAAAGFTTRYVHFTTGGKPVYWAEFGTSIWDPERMQPDPAAFSRQADYLELFYRQALDAGANGLAPWWWPGGYRVNEESDFGIMNPDGTPRPSAEVIARYAPRLEASREYPVPDTWLTIDRDAHPGGYWWIIFHEGADAYSKAHAEGHNLGIRTAGTGTDSCTTPLVAVGNRPYNGHNPLKYLNAEFNWLQVLDRDRKWVDVQNMAQIPVSAGKPVRARVSFGNTEEAAWLTLADARGRPGAVFLAAAEGSGLALKLPIPASTPSLSDADLGTFNLSPGVNTRTRVVLQMTADGRGWFGEKREFTLAPG